MKRLLFHAHLNTLCQQDMVKRVLEDGAGAEYLADLDLDAAAEGDETHDHHHNEL